MHSSSPPDTSTNASSSDEKTLQVLLVEDNPGDARLFEEYLRESSTEAVLRHEETLQAGCRVLKECPPDVVVVDLGLPDSGGPETVTAAAAAAPGVPIVVLTGQEDLGVALEVQEAGATEYLQKRELGPALVGRTLRWAVQRSQMQEKLQQRDAWIRSITEGLSAGVFRTGPTGQIKYANEALAEMLGFERADRLVGLDLTDFQTDPFQRGRMLVNEGASDVEVGFEGREGSRFVGLLTAKVVCDGNGDVLHYDGVITDITERVRREERLRMLSQAVEQATEAVLITEAGPLDEPGPRVEYVNSAFEEITGYSEAEICGKTPRVLQGPKTDREVLDTLRAALEAGEKWEGETVNYRKDGEPYRVQWNVAPVRNDKGAVEHWVSVQRNVTEERAREERLRLLARGLQQVGDKVVVTDREGRIEYVNEAFEEITGYSSEEVLGETPRILQSGEQSAGFYSELWDTLQSGESFHAEFVNERKDGSRYVESERISPVTDEEGRVTHYVSAGRDVTGRKERERELREKERQLEQIRENVKDVVWISTPDKSVIEFVSDAYEEIWGRTTEELKEEPMSFIEGIHPDDRERVRSAMEVQTERPEAYEEIYRVVQPSGGVRWVHDRAAGAYGEDGHLKRIVGVATDITEKKRRELELETTNTRLQLALESTDTGIFDWDMETDKVTWDEASEQLFGYEPGGFPGTYQAWADRVHPEDLPDAEKKIERAIQRGETYDVVFRVDVPGEEERWIRARGDVRYDEDGTPTRMIGIHTDVTNQKRRERELIEAKEEAERMSRLKSAFLANMSHEIRTPLTSILGFAEAIGGEVESGQRAGEVDLSMLAQFSSLIDRSGRRLMETLTGVLDLSKLQAGEMNLDLAPVDLTVEAKEAVQEFGHQAEKADIDLKAEVGAASVWAWTDAGGLQIVFRNLISNAIKYTEEGGEVRVRVRQERNMAAVDVEDTGIGMDPEKAQRLFEAFKQASEGVGREYEGTGLGLTVAKEVLGQMGGSIEVETEKEKGSRFTVRLPCTEEPRD